MEKNKKEIKKDNKGANKITLIVLCSVIVVLGVACIFAYKDFSFNRVSFTIDYLRFYADDYTKNEEKINLISNENKTCHVKYSSEISNDDTILKFGVKEVINDNEWVKQEFENGITWISYYKNSRYIIQMYANDKKVYNNECKEEFEEIKNSFSFLKNE